MRIPKIVLNDLYDYDLKIYQYDTHFKFSIDSILLAEYVKITNRTKEILDLCTGNASVPLILSTKTKANIEAIEVQKDVYDLAVKSISYNKLDHQITVYNNNILDIKTIKGLKKYDIITCNPPYFKVDEKSYTNDFEPLAIARHEILVTLDDIFRIASEHLDSKGEFYLIHRLERLDEIIILGNKYKLNVKNIELIKTKEKNKPSMVLVRCIKNSKMGIKISNPVSIEGRTTYQDIFKEEV